MTNESLISIYSLLSLTGEGKSMQHCGVLTWINGEGPRLECTRKIKKQILYLFTSHLLSEHWRVTMARRLRKNIVFLSVVSCSWLYDCFFSRLNILPKNLLMTLHLSTMFELCTKFDSRCMNNNHISEDADENDFMIIQTCRDLFLILCVYAALHTDGMEGTVNIH